MIVVVNLGLLAPYPFSLVSPSWRMPNTCIISYHIKLPRRPKFCSEQNQTHSQVVEMSYRFGNPSLIRIATVIMGLTKWADIYFQCHFVFRENRSLWRVSTPMTPETDERYVRCPHHTASTPIVSHRSLSPAMYYSRMPLKRRYTKDSSIGC